MKQGKELYHCNAPFILYQDEYLKKQSLDIADYLICTVIWTI